MELLQTVDKLKMDSLEISELTGKLHKNVTRDIEKMFKELEIDKLKFELNYKDSMNRERNKYNLTKDLVLTLISGYSIKLRKKIIDRWQELETPKTFEEIMQNALFLADKKVKELETKIKKDKPLVTFAKTVSASNSSLLIREYSKLIYEE